MNVSVLQGGGRRDEHEPCRIRLVAALVQNLLSHGPPRQSNSEPLCGRSGPSACLLI